MTTMTTMTSDVVSCSWWMVATTDGIGHDSFEMFESLFDAMVKYRELVRGDAYSVTLCPVALSTDYEPHPMLHDLMGLVTQVMGVREWVNNE